MTGISIARFYNYPVPRPGQAGYIETSASGLCGWNEANLSTICYGDSGGPLVGVVNGKQYLVGVASAVRLRNCQLEFQLGFYANASLFRDFVSAVKTRELDLGFEGFCPQQLRPSIEYGAGTAPGRSRVTLSWQATKATAGHTLYFSPLPQADGFIGQKSLSGQATEFSMELKSGERYVVALRAHNARCAGDLSATVLVNVP